VLLGSACDQAMLPTLARILGVSAFRACHKCFQIGERKDADANKLDAMRWRGWTSCASAIVLDADNQWQHETLRLRGADGRFNEADFAKITVTDSQRRALADAADDGTRRAREQ
jgi:hypothetical protein